MNLHGTFRSYWGAIGVPILDPGDGSISTVTHDWANAAASLGGGLAVTIMRLQIRNMRVDIAKERICEMALQNKCRFLLLIDDDVVAPPDGLMKMIKLWKSDPKYKIISGVYWSKSEPSMPLIFRDMLEGSYWDWTTQDLIKADGAGAGFLFIDTEILKKMSKPWFSCDYYFEDPRGKMDLDKWHLTDQLVAELTKGENADQKTVKDIETRLQAYGEDMKRLQRGDFAPNLMKDTVRDTSTTEDLYFFKKAKEELGDEGQLWIDCSIQCQHQDKRTGRMFGMQPDYPQARPRYAGRYKPGDQIVLDIGAGITDYWIEEGKPIKIDNDPEAQPDILADARNIPIEDCFADMVFSSHTLEHFSFKETINVLKEWVRVLKVDGKLVIVVPNLKWAAKQVLLDNKANGQDAERAMFMYYSAQKGDLHSAYQDVHRAGFTAQSLAGVLSRVKGLGEIEIATSDGNYGNWKEYLLPDDSGYNIIAIAKKTYHDAPVSLMMPIKTQEDAKPHIGDKANTIGLPQLRELLRRKGAHMPDANLKTAKKTQPTKKVSTPKKPTKAVRDKSGRFAKKVEAVAHSADGRKKAV